MKTALVALLLSGVPLSHGVIPLKVGDKAIEFILPDTAGNPVGLRPLLERGPVVVTFFVKAFSPGCTRQLKAWRARHAELVAAGGQLVAISTDDPATLARFKTATGAPFALLSDKGGEIARQYAGLITGTRSNRATFAVGADGIVRHVASGVRVFDPSGAIAALAVQGNVAPMPGER